MITQFANSSTGIALSLEWPDAAGSMWEADGNASLAGESGRYDDV